MKETGKVFLVGAGPGDPGLITEKGLKRLRECDVVVYDHLASERFLDEVPEESQRIYVGKKAGCHYMKQEEINQLLVDLAREGKNVVRLKGGDPFVFGRGGEEVMAVSREGIPFEVVSGVTSAVAALASAGGSGGPPGAPRRVSFFTPLFFTTCPARAGAQVEFLGGRCLLKKKKHENSTNDTSIGEQNHA